MTLASRLGTLSNTGGLSTGWADTVVSNLALVQTQGIAVGAAAAALPIIGAQIMGEK